MTRVLKKRPRSLDPSDPRRRVLARLEPWLDDDEGGKDHLVRWLQRYELPWIGYDDEPFEWLLRALTLASNPDLVRIKLATWLAGLLNGERDLAPGKQTDVDRREQLLYNALMLAAGLRSPDLLQEPLQRILEHRDLAGRWLSYDLRGALLHALIHNQGDGRLRSTWIQMIQEGRHDFLPGDEDYAFSGILQMPEPPGSEDLPALDAVGEALGILGSRLVDRSDREAEFKRFLELVWRSVREHTTLVGRLYDLAYNHKWSLWMTRCAATLVPNGSKIVSSGFVTMIVPKSFADYASSREFGLRHAHPLGSGWFMQVDVPKQAMMIADVIAEIFSTRWEKCPFYGEAAYEGVSSHVANYLDDILKYIIVVEMHHRSPEEIPRESTLYEVMIDLGLPAPGVWKGIWSRKRHLETIRQHARGGDPAGFEPAA
jgi:hypothetical protein